jgi:hypothetical protein
VGCTTPDPTAINEVVDNEVIAEVTSCPTGQWCLETLTKVSSILRGVWAVSADDVFAVGHGGTILRRISGVWTVMSSGTSYDLHAVWAMSSSNVWAAGSSGIILHFDGTAWSIVPSGTTSDIDAVWGSSATDVWFAGSGQVLHWAGLPVTLTPFGGSVLSISGTGPMDVWIAGETMQLGHFDGTSWHSSNPPETTTTEWFAILAIRSSDVWATSTLLNKETWHYTGAGNWTAQKVGLGITFASLAARASNDIWGVGGTHVGHWNGAAWFTTQPFGTSVALHSVTTTTGDVWVVGDAGLIAHQVP